MNIENQNQYSCILSSTLDDQMYKQVHQHQSQNNSNKIDSKIYLFQKQHQNNILTFATTSKQDLYWDSVHKTQNFCKYHPQQSSTAIINLVRLFEKFQDHKLKINKQSLYRPNQEALNNFVRGDVFRKILVSDCFEGLLGKYKIWDILQSFMQPELTSIFDFCFKIGRQQPSFRLKKSGMEESKKSQKIKRIQRNQRIKKNSQPHKAKDIKKQNYQKLHNGIMSRLNNLVKVVFQMHVSTKDQLFQKHFIDKALMNSQNKFEEESQDSLVFENRSDSKDDCISDTQADSQKTKRSSTKLSNLSKAYFSDRQFYLRMIMEFIVNSQLFKKLNDKIFKTALRLKIWNSQEIKKMILCYLLDYPWMIEMNKIRVNQTFQSWQQLSVLWYIPYCYQKTSLFDDLVDAVKQFDLNKRKRNRGQQNN